MLVLIASAMLTAVPASAQPKPPTPYDRAIAAGYKALTLCSGIFNAGRTQAQIEALELTGIYPQYDAIVPTLDAKVDMRQHMVSVAFDEKLPPREAGWSTSHGCKIYPIGGGGIRTGGPRSPSPAIELRIPSNRRTLESELRDTLRWERPKSTKYQAALDDVISAVFDDKTFGAGSRTTGVVILRDHQLMGERYREGFRENTSQRTWSVAKSITGTLIGIAVQKGIVDVDKVAPIPEWKYPLDPRAAITTNLLLRMASGLHSATAGNRTDAIYFGGTAVTQETTAWPLDASPGTRFRYANNDILLAMRALRAKLGDQAYTRFPTTELFDKIGMTRTVAETDWQGNFILSSQVWSTARDLARFGLLYLNDGIWNGERLLPEGWIKYVTTPSGPQPDGPFGYGATFWLMNNSPGVPADTYAAFGNRGQYVVIVPSRKIVIVRRGEDPTGASFDIATFTADILAALK